MIYRPRYKVYTTFVINKVRLKNMYKFLRRLKLYDTN